MEKQWNEASLDVENMTFFLVWFREDHHNACPAWDRRDFDFFNRNLREGAVFNPVAIVKCRSIDGVFDRCNTRSTPWIERIPTFDNPDRVVEILGEGMRKRSMSVGDVVECLETGRHFLCSHNGWAEFQTPNGFDL